MKTEWEYIGPLEEQPTEPEWEYLGPLYPEPKKRFEFAVGAGPGFSFVPPEWRDPKHPDYQPSIYAAPRTIDFAGMTGIKAIGTKAIKTIPVLFGVEKELASRIVVQKTGARTPMGILSHYQSKYPKLRGVSIGGLEATRKSGPLVDEGVSRMVLDKSGRLDPTRSRIHLTPDASPITVRHEIEHLLDVIHGGKLKPQTMGRFEHAKFTSQYVKKFAGSVNLERQALVKAAKELELRAAGDVPKKIQTWDETGKLSSEIMSDYDRAVKAIQKVKGIKGLTESFDAARKINVNAVNRLKEMAQTESVEVFNESFVRYRDDIFKTLSDGSSEVGRALNIHKRFVGVNRMTKAFAKLERTLNPRELEELKRLNIENPIEVKRFIGRLGDPRFRDYFYEYWYNQILSGPPTHVVNITSNTAWAAFQLPHRALTAGVDRIYTTLTGKARSRYLNELVPMMAGYKTGFPKGAKAAWEVIRTGRITDYETKWAQEIGFALGAFERSPYKPLRKIAPYLTMPTRALRAMDVWANSIAYDAHARALARRASNTKGLTGKTRDTFELNFLKEMPGGAHDKSVAQAKYSTFMDDPGKFSSWIIQGRAKIPGFRIVVPFVNTIGNLMKRGLEMTPGVGLAMKGKQITSEVIAKQIEGAILSLYVLHKVDIGEITGAAPKGKAERDAFYRQGKMSWSIKLGDNWYQYRRIEPFNTTIASATILYEALRDAKDDEDAMDIFLNAARAFKDNLIDSSYLQSVNQIFNRYGGTAGVVRRTVTGLVPYSSFWRSINRAYEAATEGTAKLRETDDWLGTVSTVIPGLSAETPARLNVWGEEIVLPGGVFRHWLPYKWSEEVIDPVEHELELLGRYPGLPSNKVTIRGEKVELDEETYRDYCISYGRLAKQRLMQVIISPHYQRMSLTNKRKAVSRELKRIKSRELSRVRHLHLKIKSSNQPGPPPFES